MQVDFVISPPPGLPPMMQAAWPEFAPYYQLAANEIQEAANVALNAVDSALVPNTKTLPPEGTTNSSYHCCRNTAKAIDSMVKAVPATTA